MHSTIREYNQNDTKTVRYICSALDTNIELASLLFCDYYLDNNKDLCYVAVDEFNNPCGCILATDNYFKYKQEFSSYLNKIKTLSFKTYLHYTSLQKKLDEVNLLYPAHFTIVVLPSFRNNGCGKQLFETLKNKLQSSNVKGINIILNKNNNDAISFFERLGFEKYQKITKNEYIYIFNLIN